MPHGHAHATSWVLPPHRRAQRAVNRADSSLVMNGMLLLLALCGWIIGGEAGVRWAVSGETLPPPPPPAITPEAMRRQFGARLLRRSELPALFDILAVLSRRAGLPHMPELYCLPEAGMNAYALGSPDHSAITLTEGLLRGMTLNEVAGILAHEVAHIRNDDGAVMTLAAALHCATALVAGFGPPAAGGPPPNGALAALLRSAPAIGRLLHLALSRIREFDADIAALELTGDAYGLMAALDKMEAHHSGVLTGANGQRRATPPSFDAVRFLRSHPETWERLRTLESRAQMR